MNVAVVVRLGFMPWLPLLRAISEVHRRSCFVIDPHTNLEWRMDLARPSGRYQRTRQRQANCTKTSPSWRANGVARVTSGLQGSSILAERTCRKDSKYGAAIKQRG